MNKPAWTLVVSDSHEASWNLATEEFLTRQVDFQTPIIFLWRNNPTVVVGRNQNTYDEVNLALTHRDRVPVIRRNSGGGTVYHDLGNLNFSLILNQDEQNFDYATLIQPLIAFLREQGLEVQVKGRNDLFIGDQKVAGLAAWTHANHLLVHGAILYQVDLQRMQNYLIVNEQKLAHQRHRSHASPVVNLATKLEHPVSSENFFQKLIRYTLLNLPAQERFFNSEQLNQIKHLQNQKFRQDEWNFGPSGYFEFVKKAYVPNVGYLKFNLNINEGKIKHAHIYGDFLGSQGTKMLETKLENIPFTVDAVTQALTRTDLKAIFGPELKQQQILDLLFA